MGQYHQQQHVLLKLAGILDVFFLLNPLLLSFSPLFFLRLLLPQQLVFLHLFLPSPLPYLLSPWLSVFRFSVGFAPVVVLVV